MVSREGFDRGIWEEGGSGFWLEFRSSIERFLLNPFSLISPRQCLITPSRAPVVSEPRESLPHRPSCR